MGTKLSSFIRSNAIGLLALFVALGGTGYAAVKINGKDIKNGSIAGKKLKKHTLTETQINLSRLGTVPSASNATSATNASALGGSPAASFLKTGCGPGKVNGYAHIYGAAASFPTTYTSSTTFIDRTFNCSGQAVEVRRESAGEYYVKFPGNPGTIGFGNVSNCPTGRVCLAAPPKNVTVQYVSTGADAGSFAIGVAESGSSSGAEDEDVDVLIP